jgi:four helix bundle protein
MDKEMQKIINEIKNSKKISPVKSFRDLEVYQISYKASIVVVREIVNKLPNHENFNLKDQLKRSAMAIPRLIAEGFAKRKQKKNFQKYLDDAAGETNETEVSLQQSLDFYGEFIDKETCKWLIDLYSKIGGKIFKTKDNWYSC